MADGRRVLFVSEKTAALDVVKRRLTEVGLGGFCLDLHSDRGKKASVYSQLREAMEQAPAEPQDFPYERLLTRRCELNAIVRAIHEVRQPLGLSVFTVHGLVAAIRDVPRLNVLVRDVGALDGDRLRRTQDAVRQISRRVTEFREHHTSRWRSLGPVLPSPRLADVVRDDLTMLRSAIESVLNAVADASAMCGIDAPKTLLDAADLVRLIVHLKNAPGAVPSQWLEPGGLDRSRVSTDVLRQRAADRRGLLDALSASISGAPPGPQSLKWLDIALAVALSRSQADLIQELIDLRRLSDRRFDERFAEDAHERFFVKNLENVQGDERDHVILSIGYGPTTASGAVPNRFGPVNVEGGHRRLNVAVSRARRSMTVVHSLRPEDIHSEAQGAKLLRRYLEFLRGGEASIEGAVIPSPGGEAESPFEDAVGRALEQRGYRIQRQVGCAKYSIDIAIVGAARNEAITATARAFGYARTGDDIEGCISKAVDRLLAAGRLVERVGSLVLPA